MFYSYCHCVCHERPHAVQLLMLYSCCYCICHSVVFPHAVQFFMLYSCCHCIFQFSALRHAIQFSLCCTVSCHFICQHSSLSCAVQLPLLHIPQCYVSLPLCCRMPCNCLLLYSSSHSAACRIVAAIVYANVLGCRMSYSCSCCTVTATVYATVLCVFAASRSVMFCHMVWLYSGCHFVCQGSVLPHAIAHVVQLQPLCMPVLGMCLLHAIQLLGLYSCCHYVCQYFLLTACCAVTVTEGHSVIYALLHAVKHFGCNSIDIVTVYYSSYC